MPNIFHGANKGSMEDWRHMMKERPLPELRREAADYMRKLQYSESRIDQAGTAWNHLQRFMDENGHPLFSAEVADGFHERVLMGRRYEDLPRWDRDKILLVGMLVEVLHTGCIKYKRDRKFVALTGPIADEAASLVSELRERGYSQSTIDSYKANLNRFSQFMQANGIDGLASVTPAAIISYMELLSFSGNDSRTRAAAVLRALLRRAYEGGVTADDMSRHVPKTKKVRQPSLPSVYAPEEIDAVLGAVDRASAKGKRDYAMLMLAARLGLRASDICGLEFSDLDWRSSTLRALQAKTGEAVELPILPDVGAAIIDYVRYARPRSDLPYVFLHVVRPFDRLASSTLASIVTQYVNAAGVNADGARKHGAHSLRHSLAAGLLEAQTPLPVISAVLGHASSESTRYYLRVDEQALGQCALEVPEVTS